MSSLKSAFPILQLFYLAYHNRDKDYLFIAHNSANLKNAWRLLLLACEPFKSSVNSKNKRIALANGSTISCITSEEMNKAVGRSFSGVLLDEWVKHAKD